MAREIWVGIEVENGLRMAGLETIAGLPLLERAARVALRLTDPAHVRLLVSDPDEAALELCGRLEIGECTPFDFVVLLSEEAKADRVDGAAVLLRQAAPLRDERDVHAALEALEEHRCVLSASVPPPGHPWHMPLPGQSRPDYRCRAFEVRRLTEFSPHRRGASLEEHLLAIDWESFVDLAFPAERERAKTLLPSWPRW